MKIYLLLLLSIFTLSAHSQGLFEEKYDDCSSIKPCRYCGDTLPRPPINFREKIAQKIETRPSGYSWIKPGKLLYEILIDSTGHSCIVSIDDQLLCYEMKQDILEVINDMFRWKPAVLFGRPINATMVLQFDFGKTTYRMRFLERNEVPIKKEE
ncbi:MAG: hypothetical protein K0Q79_2561 [Flavipsychrobacter sp.]|jgi:hypothetical protein|nr:hypothetical protein [Flavipsychrobacter sp.]